MKTLQKRNVIHIHRKNPQELECKCKKFMREGDPLTIAKT